MKIPPESSIGDTNGSKIVFPERMKTLDEKYCVKF